MNNQNIYKRKALTLGLLALSASTFAQTVADTTQVNVAFGTKAQSELLGGVSAIDMENLTSKNYST